MTAGHRHRIVRVKRNGLVHRVLTRPTLAVVGTERAERSRMVFGPTGHPERWRLSPLGALHAFTGLTLKPVDRSDGT